MAARQNGFTLLEVLVALVLMAMFTVTSYRALNAVLEAGRHASGEMQRWRVLSSAFAHIGNDLGNVVPPTAIATPIGGGGLAGFIAGHEETGAAGFALDRQLPADEGGQLQRVGYRFADGRLIKLVWRDETIAPDETPLLDGIGQLSFAYLDARSAWQPVWPAHAGVLPRAVEVRMTLASGESLRRVFRLL